jgi:hypothetical protein
MSYVLTAYHTEPKVGVVTVIVCAAALWGMAMNAERTPIITSHDTINAVAVFLAFN